MKVFLTDLSDISDNLIHRYEALLSPSEKARYINMSNPKRRLQFLTGRALIYENCRETPSLSSMGKPFISSSQISLSHSGPYVALILSDSPVGIDIEDSSHVRPFQDLSERLGFPQNTPFEFYKHFTRYESDFKLGVKNEKIYHFFYSIDTFIICISSLKNKENIEFIKSVPFIRSAPFIPEILT